MYNTEAEVSAIQKELESLQEQIQELIDDLQKVDGLQSIQNLKVLRKAQDKSRAVKEAMLEMLSKATETLRWLEICEREYLDDKRSF